nr:retrotransposon protein, putative, Ty1-copia subclass [Tanacetum cinerariifolium]
RKNKTWELVDHQAGQKMVTCKWLFKIKEGIKGVQKPRYKARLVARGFTQRAGIDYNEVFSPVVRHTSIRVILALTACNDFELKQLDVKTSFLHGHLEEVIYMREPPGYEQGNKVCLLKKSLYGLKQSPRQWYRRFDEYMLSNGFKRSSYDICVYYRSYAPDDMLIACKSKAESGSTKSLLKREFDMKDLEEAKKILGMEIIRDRSRKIIRVSQSGYISKILNNFRIDNGKSVQMPLDIAYAVSIVSRYLANQGKNHWEAVKWILKYLRGTTNVGLIYGTNHRNHKDVTGFVDLDYAKDPDKGRSITGYAFLVQGCVVCTEHNAADALTKVVHGRKLQHCLELLSVGADKSVEELQVEVELPRLNNHTLEEDQTDNKDQTDQDDGDDEDAGVQEIDQPPDLTDYQLVRDREPRTRKKPLRFRDESNMAAYAFAAAEEEDTHEPLTYQEAVACEDSSKWKAALKEEMDSLMKKKTWELVDH